VRVVARACAGGLSCALPPLIVVVTVALVLRWCRIVQSDALCIWSFIDRRFYRREYAAVRTWEQLTTRTSN